MVKMPPFLLGLTLLFWGWEVGWLWLGIPGAVILELPRWIRWRWDFTETDMNRFWDLSYILFLGALGYSFMTTDMLHATFRFTPLLPLIFFPFLTATLYCAEDRVTLSTFSLFLHRKGRDGRMTRPAGWFVPYGYFVACFVAASVANERDLRFYTGVVVLGGWMLWTIRSRAAAAWVWVVMTALVSLAGYGGHSQLIELQAWIESRVSGLVSGTVDLTQRQTAIGSLGELKMSNQIVLRVRMDGQQPPPALLRRTSYDSYNPSGRTAMWIATVFKFSSVQSATEPTSWVLSPQPPSATATLSMAMPQNAGLLPLPDGPCRLEGLIAGTVEANRCGTVRVHYTLPLTRYTVKYCGISTLDEPPTQQDLAVPAAEIPALAQIAGELNLAGRPPAEVLRRVIHFFHDHFTYRTHLQSAATPGGPTALNRFLLRDRAGHCEFFATATTLLLRQAGVPARYATGYAVQGATDSTGEYIVRQRHAHAWVLVHMNGAWRDFDTTPAAWGGMEDAQNSTFQWVSDLASALKYRLASWRYYGDRAALLRVVGWFVPVLVLWFLWRIFGKKGRVRRKDRKSRATRPVYAGADSEFYLIEKHLARAGFPRREEEPLGEWMHRLDTARRAGLRIPPLEEIVALHYTYRFDPRGLTNEQRRELKTRAAAWLRDAGETAATV